MHVSVSYLITFNLLFFSTNEDLSKRNSIATWLVLINPNVLFDEKPLTKPIPKFSKILRLAKPSYNLFYIRKYTDVDKTVLSVAFALSHVHQWVC